MKTTYEIRTPDLKSWFISFDDIWEARAYYKEHVKDAPVTHRMHGAVVVEHSRERHSEAETARLNWLEANLGKVVPGSADAKFWILGQKEFAPNKATNIRAAIDAARGVPQTAEKIISPA